MAVRNTSIAGNISSNYSGGISSSVDINQVYISFALFGSLSTIWIIITNMVLVVAILSSAALRRKGRNILIVSIAVSDLLIGFVACPAIADLGVSRRQTAHCFLRATLRVLFRYSDIFIPAWGLVFLGGDYMRRQLRLEFPKIQFCKETLVDILLALLPWATFIVVVIPVIFTGLHDTVNQNKYLICSLFLTKQTETALNVVCYFIPAFTILTLVISFIVYRTCVKHKIDVQSRGLLEEENTLESPICSIVPMVVTVGLALPDQVFYTLHYTDGINIVDPVAGVVMYLFISYLDVTRAGILPLTWLLFKDVRTAVTDILRCRPWRTKLPTNQEPVSVSYKNMNEDA